MYEVSIERVFRATHAIMMAGERETTHEHQWRVSVAVAGGQLDEDGLLCDFHVLEQLLEGVAGRWQGRDLNQTPPFDRVNPTAENIAAHIAETLVGDLPPSVSLTRVSVTEAPGCVASYLSAP